MALAAGMGSRYGGLKQLEPIGPNGEALMDYSIYDALRTGFNRLVFVIRRDIEEAFREKIGRRFAQRIKVDYVFQELDCVPAGFLVPPERQKPWGTGHAVLMAAEAVDGPFGVINADDFYGANSFRILAEHLRSGTPDYALVGFVLRNTLSEFGAVARGIGRLDSAGYLLGIKEVTNIEAAGKAAKYTDASGRVHPLTGDEMVSLNMWGFHPNLFAELGQEFRTFLAQHGQEQKKEFYLPSVVNTLIEAGKARVKVLPTPDAWFGMTYRQDRDATVAGINQLVRAGQYPESLWD